MPKHGKNFRAAAEKVEKFKLYTPLEAVRLVKEIAPAKFDETVEAHFRLGIPVGGLEDAISFVLAPGLAVLAIDVRRLASLAQFGFVFIQKLLLFRGKGFDFPNDARGALLALPDHFADRRDEQVVEHHQRHEKVDQLDP